MRFTRIVPLLAPFAIASAALYLGLSGAAQEEEGARLRQASMRSGISWGLPPVATPLDNPQTPDKVALVLLGENFVSVCISSPLTGPVEKL